jgi:hypothetical protein
MRHVATEHFTYIYTGTRNHLFYTENEEEI